MFTMAIAICNCNEAQCRCIFSQRRQEDLDLLTAMGHGSCLLGTSESQSPSLSLPPSPMWIWPGTRAPATHRGGTRTEGSAAAASPGRRPSSCAPGRHGGRPLARAPIERVRNGSQKLRCLVPTQVAAGASPALLAYSAEHYPLRDLASGLSARRRAALPPDTTRGRGDGIPIYRPGWTVFHLPSTMGR
jgi:hypothetical protein